tara:strand:+ start:148 stop:498 length:351 start_codon:yes stop_codon:yes gene_type:complete
VKWFFSSLQTYFKTLCAPSPNALKQSRGVSEMVKAKRKTIGKYRLYVPSGPLHDRQISAGGKTFTSKKKAVDYIKRNVSAEKFSRIEKMSPIFIRNERLLRRKSMIKKATRKMGRK